eukprot:7407040-Pyramimonas_sp.AAC.2
MEHSKANHYVVENKVGETLYMLSAEEMPELPVLYLKDCKFNSPVNFSQTPKPPPRNVGLHARVRPLIRPFTTVELNDPPKFALHVLYLKDCKVRARGVSTLLVR